MRFLHYTPVAMPPHLPILMGDEAGHSPEVTPALDSAPADSSVMTMVKALLGRLRKRGLPDASKGPDQQAFEEEDQRELQCHRLRDKAERVALRHRVTRGEQAPENVLRNVLCRFNQQQVERFTLKIALEKGISEKNLELYLSLASQLHAQGVDLGDFGAAARHSEFHPITIEAGIVDHIKRDLEAHRKNRSKQYCAAFEADLAVASALRCLYAQDYRDMVEDRHYLEDELWDRLLNPESSDAQLQTAKAQLPMLNSVEQEWYQMKMQDALDLLDAERRNGEGA